MSLQKTQGFVSVSVAIAGDGFVTVIKFVAAFMSGSSSMFSEAVHSLADTVNQILLLIGLRQSLRKATNRHEYGFGNERFFWALISACGIFFVGAGVTFVHGIEAILHPEEVAFSWIVMAVLGVSFVIEIYTFLVAVREIKRALPDSTWVERIQEADTTTLTVLLEDFIALVGILVATISISLAAYTGNAQWDGIGSIIISFLLAFVAVVLIIRNREYLLGKALPEEVKDEVILLLKKEPAIEKVIDFKSSALGLGVYRIKCEVEFNGVALLRSAYRGTTLLEQFEEVRNDVEDFKRFAVDLSDRIPRLMGKKVDDIEAKIRKNFPMIYHIDIEIN